MTLDVVLEERAFGGVPVVGVPSLVKGRTLMPAWPTIGELNAALAPRPHGAPHPTDAGRYVLVEDSGDRGDGERPGPRVLVVSAPQPDALIEGDPASAIRELMSMTPDDVYGFVDAVGHALERLQPAAADSAAILLICAASRSGGKVEVSGRPPASEITSGRAVTAIRSRIAEERLTLVRSAKRPA